MDVAVGMDTARRVVITETGMGVLWILLGVVNVGIDGFRGTWWLVALAAVATAALVYADEQRLGDWDEFSRGALAIAGVLAAVVAVWVVVWVTTLSVPTAVSAAMAGTGVGLVGYRVVFGVVRPVPESRLEASRERAV